MTKKEKITEEDLLFLSQTTLFQGTRPDEIQAMLQCLKAVLKCYPKDAILLHAGETTHVMGLVLSGSVHIENIDVGKQKHFKPCDKRPDFCGNLRLRSR